MSEIRRDYLYTKDHEWVKKSTPNIVTVGISDFAQGALGDVTFVQLPAVNAEFKKGAILANVESVKAVSDIYAPLSGKVLKVNERLQNDPAPINHSPFDDGWLVELEVADDGEFAQLLNPEAYAKVAE